MGPPSRGPAFAPHRPGPPPGSWAPAGPPRGGTTPLLAPPPHLLSWHDQCPNCGADSDPSRRFCRRCGIWLVTPSRVAPGPPEPLGKRLRRRWWGGTTDQYTGALTRGTIGFRALSIGLVLVLVTVVLTVAGLHPIRRASDLVGHVLGTGRVAGVTAAAVPADALPGHPAAWAVDDVRGRGFATRWISGSSGNPAAACATPAPQPATASSLQLGFPKPTDVREIGFEAGLPADDAQVAARWRPRALELHWEGGTCQRVELAADAGLQRFAVDQPRPVRSVTIVVVAGYPPETGGSDRLDIGEVTFWQR